MRNDSFSHIVSVHVVSQTVLYFNFIPVHHVGYVEAFDVHVSGPHSCTLAPILFQKNGAFVVLVCDDLGGELWLTKHEQTSAENVADCIIHACKLRLG